MQIRSKFVFCALCFLLITFYFVPFAYSLQGNKWWQKSDEGWFFYKDPPKAVKDKPKDKAVEDKPRDRKIETQKPKDEPLATEVLKRQTERFLSEAMVEPTEANVKRYMEHQKRMMQLADRFALIWQRVLMKYPELYAQVSTEGVNEEIKQAIFELREKAGLFFIYSSSCPHCLRMAEVIKDFREKYGFMVIPVTIDGGILPEFPDTQFDNGISMMLGIQTVPAVFLAYPYEDRFEPINTGFISLPDLERRLYHYAITEAYSHSNRINFDR